jgi:hypothetical protein
MVIAPSSFGSANKGIDLQFNILQGFYGTKKMCGLCEKIGANGGGRGFNFAAWAIYVV